MPRTRQRKGRRWQTPTALTRPPNTWLEQSRYHHPMWSHPTTPHYSLGCAQAGHPRQFSTGAVTSWGCQNARRPTVTHSHSRPEGRLWLWPTLPVYGTLGPLWVFEPEINPSFCKASCVNQKWVGRFILVLESMKPTQQIQWSEPKSVKQNPQPKKEQEEYLYKQNCALAQISTNQKRPPWLDAQPKN